MNMLKLLFGFLVVLNTSHGSLIKTEESKHKEEFQHKIDDCKTSIELCNLHFNLFEQSTDKLSFHGLVLEKLIKLMPAEIESSNSFVHLTSLAKCSDLLLRGQKFSNGSSIKPIKLIPYSNKINELIIKKLKTLLLVEVQKVQNETNLNSLMKSLKFFHPRSLEDQEEIDDLISSKRHQILENISKQDNSGPMTKNEKSIDKTILQKIDELKPIFDKTYTQSCSLMPDKAVDTLNSSINFMWINKQRLARPDDYYIFPQKQAAVFLPVLESWAALNYNSIINIWYDEDFISKNAVNNTALMLKTTLEKADFHGKLIFQNIRDLPEVKDHPESFSEDVPVYYRADLLRVIAALHEIDTKKTDTFLYSDMDIKNSQLSQGNFIPDDKIKRKLKKHGFVLGKTAKGYENGFQIISSQNTEALKQLKAILIDINIERIKLLKKLRNEGKDASYVRAKDGQKFLINPEQVFKDYSTYFRYVNSVSERPYGYFMIKRKGVPTSTFVRYDMKIHGTEPILELALPSSFQNFEMKYVNSFTKKPQGMVNSESEDEGDVDPDNILGLRKLPVSNSPGDPLTTENIGNYY